ncbi:hypothetical protein HPB50_007896 [Hyalomma asiaticum]|uniref:Uncharacterized protein n=1 Tax=Hyalomma asiaticum TaxID=266040 RepID=A0ACB7RVW6_HYAAI|nr:hypothetical protein HPB50_007896 [Hyalomma asiaticum]
MWGWRWVRTSNASELLAAAKDEEGRTAWSWTTRPQALRKAIKPVKATAKVTAERALMEPADQRHAKDYTSSLPHQALGLTSAKKILTVCFDEKATECVQNFDGVQMDGIVMSVERAQHETGGTQKKSRANTRTDCRADSHADRGYWRTMFCGLRNSSQRTNKPLAARSGHPDQVAVTSPLARPNRPGRSYPPPGSPQNMEGQVPRQTSSRPDLFVASLDGHLRLLVPASTQLSRWPLKRPASHGQEHFLFYHFKCA